MMIDKVNEALKLLDEKQTFKDFHVETELEARDSEAALTIRLTKKQKPSDIKEQIQNEVKEKSKQNWTIESVIKESVPSMNYMQELIMKLNSYK